MKSSSTNYSEAQLRHSRHPTARHPTFLRLVVGLGLVGHRHRGHLENPGLEPRNRVRRKLRSDRQQGHSDLLLPVDPVAHSGKLLVHQRHVDLPGLLQLQPLGRGSVIHTTNDFKLHLHNFYPVYE